MAKRKRSSTKKLWPLAQGEGQFPLPLDWVSPAENQTSDQDTTALIAEVEHTCPVCSKNLKRNNSCWFCDGCGYSSCGEGR